MAENTTPAPSEFGGERIAKVLSRAGIASRREAERLIELGEVQVNGKVISSPALNVLPTDRITVGGKPVAAPEPPRLWLYYKPEGLVTSEADEKGRATVFANLPEDMPRVMSVGRLDLNSEGLLLLTNDGELKRRLELPSTGWLRKYRVRVNGNPLDTDLEPLRKGIEVEGERFQAMTVTLDRIQGANAWLTVGLREGKNREIRRAMTAIGLTVNRLIRVSYGPFRLNELKPGEVEEVKPRVLKDQLGLTDPEEPGARPAAKRPVPGKAGTQAAAKPGAKAGTKPGARPEGWAKPNRTASASASAPGPRATGGARGAGGKAGGPAGGGRPAGRAGGGTIGGPAGGGKPRGPARPRRGE